MTNDFPNLPLPEPISRPEDMADYDQRVSEYMHLVEPGVYTAVELYQCFRTRAGVEGKAAGTARRLGVALSSVPFVTRRQTKLGAGYEVFPQPARG